MAVGFEKMERGSLGLKVSDNSFNHLIECMVSALLVLSLAKFINPCWQGSRGECM